MRPPADIIALIETHLAERVSAMDAVGGGCIAHTLRLRLASGRQTFLKWGSPHELPQKLFSAEALALQRLHAAGAVRVPEVLHVYAGSEGGYILLEWLEPGSRTRAGELQLGGALARLHQQSAEAYGWAADNFIGSLPQSNHWMQDWPGFWREQRLLSQLKRAEGKFSRDQHRRIEEVAGAAGDIIGATAADGPSLLHGDLWSGNVHYLADGSAALIDPSSYYGHREVDLAMSDLFGGFGRGFYEAYEEVWPTAPGLERRIWLYQLYYLLVHVNLFGGSYAAQTMSAVARLGF